MKLIVQKNLFPELIYIICLDVTGRARLADFGISRRLPKDQTTYRSGMAGTECWMAKETLAGGANIPYKWSSDIQVSFSATPILLMTG